MKNLIAIGLLVCGIALLVFGIPEQKTSLEIAEQREILSGSADFPELHGFFKAHSLRQLTITSTTEHSLVFHQALYKDNNDNHSALVFINTNQQSLSIQPKSTKANAWQEFKKSWQTHAPDDNTVLLGWWDNSQRAHFYSGATVWLQSPVAEMFTAGTAPVWEQLSGGFNKNPKSATQMAEWLLMDVDDALKSINIHFKNQTVRLLVSIDDLSRLTEMAAMTRHSVPFETRIFNNADNLHTLIAQVKRWAHDQGSGSYLLQKISPVQIRAWKINSQTGEKTLLARLLPFTSSLASTPPHLKLLHRSKTSNYLSLHQIIK
ncbi:MAG: hypothetical protein K0U68_04360 [Gammaproteobacteria bacterium]|nr:hypothetical protein [Gammaproteobacteria bacterium]